MKLFYFDLETTGVHPHKHGIHQISGAIEVDGVIKEEFNWKVRPNEKAHIDDEALKIANVTKDQVLAYPPMRTIYNDLTEMLAAHCDKFNKKDKFFLVGYNNASFDNQFLRGFFLQNGDNYFGSWFWANSIDTMVLASDFLKHQRMMLEDFKLKSVAKHLGIEVDEKKLHDAKYDIHLTREIYKIVAR